MAEVMLHTKIRKLDSVWNMCERKNKYHTQEQADTIAANRTRHAGHEIHGYYCCHCGGYHIGRKEPC
jgi:hypothetical protein